MDNTYNSNIVDELNGMVPYDSKNDPKMPEGIVPVDSITSEVARRLADAERKNLGKILDKTFVG